MRKNVDIQAGGRAPSVTVSFTICSCDVRGALKTTESEATRVLRPFCLSGGLSTRLRQSAKVPLNERDIEVAENDDEFGAEHGFLRGLWHRTMGVRTRSMRWQVESLVSHEHVCHQIGSACYAP